MFYCDIRYCEWRRNSYILLCFVLTLNVVGNVISYWSHLFGCQNALHCLVVTWGWFSLCQSHLNRDTCISMTEMLHCLQVKFCMQNTSLHFCIFSPESTHFIFRIFLWNMYSPVVYRCSAFRDKGFSICLTLLVDTHCK